jgi:mono/diheme cytochrome c family protein
MNEVKQMRLIFLLAATLWFFGLVSLSVGEEAKSGVADDLAPAGRAFALQVCAACHVVAKDQQSAPILKPPAPSFAAIVRRPKTTEAFLRAFLGAPHGKMPNPQLADFQIDEVVAYMLSLKQRR